MRNNSWIAIALALIVVILGFSVLNSKNGVLGGLVAQDEGTFVGIRPIWNFTGTGVAVTEDTANNRIDVDMSAAAGGDITAVGDVTTGAAFEGTAGTSLTFNNAGGDAVVSISDADTLYSPDRFAFGADVKDVGIGLSVDVTSTSAIKGYNTIIARQRGAVTSGASSVQLIGISGEAWLSPTNSQNWTHARGLVGLDGYIGIEAGATGTITGVDIVDASGALEASLTVTNWRSYHAFLNAGTGTITNWSGLQIDNPTAGTTITNAYGIYIEDITRGASVNWGIYNLADTLLTGATLNGILTFEGGTFDTAFQAGTPTASVTYTWPLADGTSGQVLKTNASGVLSWADDAGGGGSGDITDVGDVTTGAAFTAAGTAGTSLYFYDAQGRGQLTIANLTEARTYTLPDATGEVSLLGQTIGTAEVESGVTLDAEWDTQGEVETIWGTTLATDGELSGHTGDASDPHGATLTQTNADISGTFRILEGGGTPTFYGTLAVADLSSSGKTYTFPNFTGTVITTGNLTDITTVGTIGTGTWNGTVISPVYGGTGVANNVASTLTITGAYATTFTITNTTALTLPTSGTVTALGNSTTGTGDIVRATTPTLITPVLGAATATSLLASTVSLEGGTYDTSLIAGTPAASITYTLPANTGSSGQYLKLGASNVLSWDTPGGSGTITAIGDVASGAAFTSDGTAGTSLWFYDAQGRGQLTIANLTDVRTFTLPDATGEISLLGQEIALTTETSGNYVAGITAGTGIGVTGTPAEGWSPTIATTPEVIHIFGSTVFVVWTDMPAAETEFMGYTSNRMKMDLTYATSARLTARMNVAGKAGSLLKMQYSTDDATWVDVCTVALDGGTAFTNVGAWTAIPALSKADSYLRVVGIGGDGAIDPTFGKITLQVK